MENKLSALKPEDTICAGDLCEWVEGKWEPVGEPGNSSFVGKTVGEVRESFPGVFFARESTPALEAADLLDAIMETRTENIGDFVTNNIEKIEELIEKLRKR